MGLMDRMMDRMIVNMSVVEKENLMMQMMPAMMEGVDIKTVTPLMLNEVGSVITLSGIYNFLSKALNDGELKGEFGEIVDSLKEKVPELAKMMQDMMPMMMETGIMDGLMGLMEKVMPVMMPMMREMMPIMMNERMPKLMAQHKNVNELMPDMMIDIMPECIEMIAPEIEQGKRAAFLSRLAEKMELAERVEV
jgi:hypothetical protein